MSEVSDQELFDSATSREPQQEAPAEVVTTTEPAVTRDEAGRFAGKAVEAEEAVLEDPQGDPGKPDANGRVPSGVLRQEKEARRAAEARAADLERLLTQMRQPQHPEPKAEPAAKPELWDNPDEWVGQHLTPVAAEIQQTREFFSRRLADQVHGKEKVDSAYQALDAAIREGTIDGNAVRTQLSKSMDPFGDIMGWHAKHSVMSEIGTDPEAYKQKIIADYVASQQQPSAAAPQAPSGTVVKLPPNLNRMTSAASNAAGEADVSDQELFHATTSRRR